MKRVLTVILFPVVSLAAWEDHQVFETAMVNALSNKVELVSTAFTNQLNEFISSTTNVNDRATATLVFSISAMTLFEESLNDTLYLQSHSLATNVLSLTGLETNSWQWLGANLLLISRDTMNNKYSSAHTTATNALQIMKQTGYTDSTNRVLKTILNKTYESPDLTLQQTFSVYAGLSLAVLKSPVEARAFVSDLPLKYRQMVEEILAEDP